MWSHYDSILVWTNTSWRINLSSLQDFDTLPLRGDIVWIEVDQVWSPTYIRVWRNNPNEIKKSQED